LRASTPIPTLGQTSDANGAVGAAADEYSPMPIEDVLEPAGDKRIWLDRAVVSLEAASHPAVVEQ